MEVTRLAALPDAAQACDECSLRRTGAARGLMRNGTMTSLAGLRGVGYARLSSSTGMVRTPAVWRAYSAKPG